MTASEATVASGRRSCSDFKVLLEPRQARVHERNDMRRGDWGFRDASAQTGVKRALTSQSDMTLETLGSTAPRIHVRWFHQGPAFLLSTAPVLANSNTKWQPFTRKESDACESAWAQLPEEEQRQIERVGLAGMKDSKPAENVAELVKEELSIEAAEEDDNEAEDPVGVLVQTDRLFEVDVQKMQVCWPSEAGLFPSHKWICHFSESNSFTQCSGSGQGQQSRLNACYGFMAR